MSIVTALWTKLDSILSVEAQRMTSAFVRPYNYFQRLSYNCAGILLNAVQGTELSSDVFIILIGLVVAKISPR